MNNNLIERVVNCGTRKKDLVNNIADYIKDTVVFIVVLKVNNNWGYIVLDCNEETNQDTLNSLNKIDELCVIMQGYEMGNTSKLSISRHITYLRNEYKKQNIEEKKQENKSQTKKQISQEIEIKATEISRLLDISLVIKEACKDLKCKSIIKEYQEQLIKIKEENYKNYRNLGWKHFDKTFDKPNLKYILDKITKHLEIVNNCLDNIFVELNKIVTKLKNTQESVNLVFSEISNGEFAHATIKSNFYYLVQNLNHMRTLKEVRNIEGYEKIEKKQYQYTYKLRGFSPGCQPKKGFIEKQNITGFKFEVIIYDRKLENTEIDSYELIALN